MPNEIFLTDEQREQHELELFCKREKIIRAMTKAGYYTGIAMRYIFLYLVLTGHF